MTHERDGHPSPELLRGLEALTFSPRRVWRDPRYYYAVAKSGLDFVAHNLPRMNRVLTRVNPYPKPWARVSVPVGDGEALGGWYGPGKPGAPAILYAPGTFQTKDDSSRKARVIRLHREWGHHVLVVDLRGFGDSHALIGTGGHLEAHDLHRAADDLKARSGADRVVLVGDSLGGSSAIIAAALPGARERFAGVLAWSPFADLATQAEYASTRPALRHPYIVPYNLYRFMLKTRTRGEMRTFSDFVRVRAAELGLDPAEFLRLSSPREYARDVAVPTLVHHAEDDPIVPVDQARLLAEAAAPNPRLRVRVLSHGGHCIFDLVCPEWYWETTRRFVDGVAGSPAPTVESLRARRAEGAGAA